MPSATSPNSQVTALTCASTTSAAAPGSTPDFMGQIARLVENALPALGSDDTRFSAQAGKLSLELQT
jgi:diguanylate cyclase